MDVRPGDHLLGRYTTVERLGTGGMGEVWRATDDVLHRDVAVKFLARHLVADQDARDRFRREAQLAGSLSHPHVVAVHDAGTEQDVMVLVMELVEGGTLAERIDRDAPMPLEEALRVTREILSGLASAHEAGLVHRDVKPANVMFTDTGHVKLTDFGIARLAASESTRTAEVYGSAPYIAPERAHGRPALPASDVYAVGCVLYELLTGISPYTGDTPAVTIARHLSYDPPAPSSLVPGIPVAIDAVVARSLSKDPAERYHDAGAMLADLAQVSADAPAATVALTPATVALTRRLTRGERRTAATDATALIGVAPTRDRRSALAAVGAATVAILLLIAWNLDRGAAEGVSTPDESATAAPVGVTPTETAPDRPADAGPQSLEDAVALTRQAIADGRSAGELSVKAVEELEKKLSEVQEKHQEGDDKDARKKAKDLSKVLDERVEKGEVTGASIETLRRRVAELVALIG